jgi:predicted RNase H-like HicB family nuclease
MEYPVAIHKDKNSFFNVRVPDLPGCFSTGKTIDEALNSIKEEISSRLRILAEKGEIAPTPSTIENYYMNPDYAGATWLHVDFDVSDIFE